MKKLVALSLCFVLVAALLAGCGKVTFNTEDWADMEIRVAGYRKFSDDPLNYEFAEGAKKFTEEYGTAVEFLVGGGDGMGEDLVAGVVSGDPWEVQYVFGISVFPFTFTQELYTPITEYLDFKNNDLIDQVAVEGSKWMDEYYGVSTLPMQEVFYLAYNETWMKDLGIKTPYEYYEEGNWTMDAYMEINRQATALGAYSYTNIRPHVANKYAMTWDENTGEVTITYDSKENLEWLTYWHTLLTDPQYEVEAERVNGGQPKVSQRQAIMRDDVMPNLIKDELTQETNDVIRYINYPTKDGKIDTYLTDSYFLFPIADSQEKLPCAFMLACYMVDAKADIVTEVTYKPNMLEADYKIFEEALNNAYCLPWSLEGPWGLSSDFAEDARNGKAVATHIAEKTESLKAQAKEFNESL